MERRRGDLGKAEWVLMEALWRRQRATASELQAELAQRQGWAYSTVKTMLDRLVEKGYAASRRVGHVYEYRPRLPRPTAVGRLVDDLLDRVLQGSVTPLIDRLVERRGLSPEEINQLREMLARYEEAEPEDQP